MLTPKQQTVCNLYLTGMSMRAAMMQAGYDEKYATQNLFTFYKNRDVQAYLRMRLKEFADAARADDAFLLKNLTDIICDPTSDRIERIEARKLLEKINTRNKELAVRLKEVEMKVAEKKAEKEMNESGNIEINFNIANKENS